MAEIGASDAQRKGERVVIGTLEHAAGKEACGIATDQQTEQGFGVKEDEAA